MTAALVVERCLVPLLVVDLGRPGLAHLGVGTSGAADVGALRLANRLVGNDDAAAAIEAVAGSVTVRALRPVTVAVTGADVPIRAGGRARDGNGPCHLASGDSLELAAPVRGLRSVISVAGGVDVEAVLGSRSRDTLAGLGPPPLTVGDVVAVRGRAARWPQVDHAPRQGTAGGPVVLRAHPGPRADWFPPATLDLLADTAWRVGEGADRVGVRLDGPPLLRSQRYRGRELPSEGMVRGAVQVPPAGLPVVLGVDHPVTGGYPVLAVVAAADNDLVAQLAPGDEVRFRLDG